MTDKEKIRAEVDRLHSKWMLISTTEGYYKCKLCNQLLKFIDSMQEESVDEDFLSLVDKEARELWKEINSGNDFSIVDSFNQFYGICMQVAESTVEWQKNLQEPVSNALEEELDKYIKDNFTIDKEQLDWWGIKENDYMYSMDKSDILTMVRYFTNLQKEADIKIITDVEAVAFANGMVQMKKQIEKPVSEDLEEAMQHNAPDNIGIDDLLYWRNGFITGAKWQKEQMIAKAIDAQCFGFQGDALFSFRLPADNYLVGSKVKVIVIKED